MAQQKRGGLGCIRVKGACGPQTKKNLQKGRLTLAKCRSSFSLVPLHCCLMNLTDTAALHRGKCQRLLTLVKAWKPVGKAAQIQATYKERWELSAQMHFTGTNINASLRYCFGGASFMEGLREHLGKMVTKWWRAGKAFANWPQGKKPNQPNLKGKRSSPSWTLEGEKRLCGTLSKGTFMFWFLSRSAKLGFMYILRRYSRLHNQCLHVVETNLHWQVALVKRSNSILQSAPG